MINNYLSIPYLPIYVGVLYHSGSIIFYRLLPVFRETKISQGHAGVCEQGREELADEPGPSDPDQGLKHPSQCPRTSRRLQHVVGVCAICTSQDDLFISGKFVWRIKLFWAICSLQICHAPQ